MYLFFIASLCICTTLTFSSNNTSIIEPTAPVNVEDDTFNYTRGKDESLLSCPTIDFEEGEFEIFPNGNLYVEVYNKTWDESLYLHVNNTVTVCFIMEKEHVGKGDAVKSLLLTLAGMGISMICVLLHLIVFMIVPNIRNLPGWNLAALCLSLFFSYLLLFLVNSNYVDENRDLCIASAFLSHFFLLSSFLWMSVISYDVFLSFKRASSFRTSSDKFKLKKFSIYCTCGFGGAFVFAIAALLSDILDIVPQQFKPVFEKLCWFSQKPALLLFFAGPILALIGLNFIFFGLSAYTIHSNKMKKDNEDLRSALKKNCLMYFRLSVIMGVTWVVGIVATIANVDWVWYLFIALNTLQGLFIFLAFTCNKKVIKYFRLKLLRVRKPST